MSILIKNIAKQANRNYQNLATPNTFFGIELGKLDNEALANAIENAIKYSDMLNALIYIENQEEIDKANAKKQAEFNEKSEKEAKKFHEEITEAKAAFDHKLALQELELARSHELQTKAMAHNEAIFVADSAFTKEFISKELANAKMISDADIATKTARFTAELAEAKALADSAQSHADTIAAAQIAKAKAESEILYSYDITVLTKKVKTEVSDRYDALLAIANKFEGLEELLAVIKEDKEYFKNFSVERVERSEDVTDALIEKLNKGEKAVTVNVSEIKKCKKNQE